MSMESFTRSFRSTWIPLPPSVWKLILARGVPYLLFDDERWVRAYIPRQGFDHEGIKKALGLG